MGGKTSDRASGLKDQMIIAVGGLRFASRLDIVDLRRDLIKRT
jgi:hypothetical protein